MPNGRKILPRAAMMTEIWQDNPIFRQVLGICSSLAVTNRLFNTILMCAGLIWATSLSSLTVSILRDYIPTRIRMMISVLIISVYVIVVDIVLRAYFTEIHKDIAAYVGLIITNCIVLGRIEAFAGRNPPLASFADGLGAGVGYSIILVVVATIREFLGFGTLLGQRITYDWMLANDAQWVIMIMPPGAFFVLAIMVWLARSIDLRWQKAAKGAAK